MAQPNIRTAATVVRAETLGGPRSVAAAQQVSTRESVAPVVEAVMDGTRLPQAASKAATVVTAVWAAKATALSVAPEVLAAMVAMEHLEVVCGAVAEATAATAG
ncbi:hypothetical protein [Mycolicibacter minnesotensis]|nr:hypothetical protein [Mycolicibacter minnesotensis]